MLDGPFDVIMAVNSLGFWPDPVDRLAELRGRLADGGRIAIVAQPRSPGATASTSQRAAEEIRELLQRAGLSWLRTETLPLDPPAVCVPRSSRTAVVRSRTRARSNHRAHAR